MQKELGKYNVNDKLTNSHNVTFDWSSQKYSVKILCYYCPSQLCQREPIYCRVGYSLLLHFFKLMDSVTFFDWHVYVEGRFSTRQQNDKRSHVCMLYSLMNMSYVDVELSM